MPYWGPERILGENKYVYAKKSRLKTSHSLCLVFLPRQCRAVSYIALTYHLIAINNDWIYPYQSILCVSGSVLN